MLGKLVTPLINIVEKPVEDGHICYLTMLVISNYRICQSYRGILVSIEVSHCGALL